MAFSMAKRSKERPILFMEINPIVADSDGDNLSDGVEVAGPTVPLNQIGRAAQTVSLTWDSTESDTFSVFYSRDMINWDSGLEDGI